MATIVADKFLYEIVVINNNSTDHTNEVCQTFAQEHPDVAFRWVFEPNSGLWNARNKAIAEAQYELLSMMDDDQTILPNYVDIIIKTFENYPEYAAIGGKMLPLGEDGKAPKGTSLFLNPFVKRDFGDIAIDYPHKLSLKNPTAYFPPGGTITLRKEVFEKYGNYPPGEVCWEDIYIANKLRQNNEKILYMPDILIYHHIPKERYDYNNLMQTAYRNAKEQAKQKRSSLIDRMLKFMFSVGVCVFYFITFRPTKARYLIAFQYNWLRGYVNGMNNH